MSTRAYDNMRALADGWEKLYPSAVCAGIVGDLRHRRLRQGTYHLSRADNPPGTYSVVRPDDRTGQGPDDASAAIDMAMNKRDLTLCTARMKAVWADRSDPRRRFVNAFNGWLGSGDAIRLDMVAHAIGYASPGHKSHNHGEVRRVYVTSTAAVTAWLSALAGESKAAYLKRIGVVPAAPAARSGGKPAVPKYPGRVLSKGDKGEAVKTWQARMLARGWRSLGTADGEFGPRTESVVRRYQQLCKVSVDGKIGPVTWPLPWTRPL